MSNHATIATHVPQSLPSFAQAFSTQSLSSLPSTNNALPPIHTRLSPVNRSQSDSPLPNSRSRPNSADNPVHSTLGAKRSHDDVASGLNDDPPTDSSHKSPRLVHIKQEQEQEPLSQPSPPAVVDDHALPSAGSLPVPFKKRRVTVSGAPHSLNTDAQATSDQVNSTPLSPVVMGQGIKRDNSTQLEQPRSSINVKQKQSAIGQRRGSLSAVNTPTNGSVNTALVPVSDERLPASKQPVTRSLRKSPTNTSAIRRHHPSIPQGGPNTRPPSPTSIIAPTQQQVPIQAQTPSHSLPPPPISFARRRAAQLGAGKRKPADILISPREAQSSDQLQPAIQSAPPVPHAGQGAFYAGRYTMALPRLPPVMNSGENVRRVASNVPPTPTRLAMQRQPPSAIPAPTPSIGITGRSPPSAFVPIATTLVPPTPSSLHHPGYTGDKAAFLGPFEVFYDALNDSKQLKKWLGEQLQKSNSLMQSLAHQQDKLSEIVEGLVERKVGGMRSEMVGLQRRVEELEEALRVATVGHMDRSYPRNGNGTIGPDTNIYQQIPGKPEPSARSGLPPSAPSPAWGQDRDHRENQEVPDVEMGSPAPYRTHSMSATRSQPSDPAYGRSPFNAPSPSQTYRDASAQHLALPSTHTKASRGHHGDRDRLVVGRTAERGSGSPHGRGDSRRDATSRNASDAQVEDT
ncbi:hypothetical protein AMATHDRAFT_44972 [Amanita thiersii Skay4041]|uniref:Uncharacterized protein n=1 Tax=Amanita thiersii Skay4041 TaxID=703135 RepID=A0A2A9NZA2_9AGAR|nr:hypothetical protein AMATHDRAFT_44972 [Amanita thiersii Skay4041]